MKFFRPFVESLAALGMRKLITMAVAGVFVAGLMTVILIVMNKPVRETLYSGLDVEDINLIGAALSEVGIPFDVNVAGDAVLVDYGRTAQARMILAQRGLPRSDKSGYELFDKMGSLGLTTFMQQVTQVRALEGELVRTVQQLEGIKSARVHLALKSASGLRSKQEQATASVVIRTAGQPPETTANAIRQIVSAAIPGLRPEHVTVMTTDGTLLVTSDYGEQQGSDKFLGLESRVAQETQDRLERTLAPLVGYNNIRVSVTAQLNTDRREVTETKFDPESKVERSSRTVKTVDSSNTANAAQSVSVEQNVPQEVKASAPGGSDSTKKESKEEQINYEVNSQQTAVVSGGYRIERLSLAVVINKKAVAQVIGATDEAKIKEQVELIESLVKSASGFDKKRGDSLTVSAIDFIGEDVAMAPVAGPGFLETLTGNLGTIINMLGLIVATVLVLLLGLRPVVRMIMSPTAGELSAPSDLGGGDKLGSPGTVGFAGDGPAKAIGYGDNSIPPTGRDKLNKVVQVDVDRAAQVLKQWLDKPDREAA